MTPIDWFALLHPVLVILFVYPVVGATIRLGILVRERRLGITKQLPAVSREHSDHGLWVTAGVVVAVLIALLRVKQPLLRASFTGLTWVGLLGLGSQPEIWRLSDNPFSGAFWSSHYWSGVLLTGLLLFNLAARPEITKHLRWRRLHVASNVLIMVLLAVQAITGSRDLLEIPLSWQKPAIYRCDFQRRTCPEPGVPAAAAPGSAVAPAAA